MRKFIIAWTVAGLALWLGAVTSAQTPGASRTSPGTAQKSVAGEVTALDPASGQVMIKTSAGASTKIVTDERTIFLRVPPTQRTLDQAIRIAFADISVGDRVLARGSQIIVMSEEALAQEQERERDEARPRGIAGVITALNPRTKEITLLARAPEGSVQVTIDAPGEIRWLRYAPDSLKWEDARPSSFAQLKVGDQLRARGGRSSDGTRFTAEAIISGALTRVSGQITGVNSSAHTLTMKSEPMGQRITVTVGEKTILKRVRPEVSAPLIQSTTPGVTAADSSKKQAASERAGGVNRNLQQLLTSLPAISLVDLEKGEMVLVFGSTGTDPGRITAISLLAGDAAFITRLQGEASQNAREMNPGLPGDVLGGGTNKVEQPKSRTDPP